MIARRSGMPSRIITSRLRQPHPYSRPTQALLCMRLKARAIRGEGGYTGGSTLWVFPAGVPEDVEMTDVSDVAGAGIGIFEMSEVDQLVANEGWTIRDDEEKEMEEEADTDVVMDDYAEATRKWTFGTRFGWRLAIRH